jgi:hypothetical protein
MLEFVAMKNVPKIFLKDSRVSKPSVILIISWVIIWIWFIITDFPFMSDWPLLDIFAVPFLALLCGYYIGKYNLKDFIQESAVIWKNYQRNR